MAQVKRPRSLQSEVRLRKWPPGRVSQLKLFLGHLEQAIMISLAAQVEQSPKRQFSEFIPKITPQDVTVEVEYRELRIFFTAPRGLKNLLFYEFDISATVGFFNLDRFASPETSYVFPNLADGTTYYVRMRVVTKDGEVGPWSNTEEATTPIAQAFGLYDATEETTRVSTRGNQWDAVYQRQYNAIGGKTYYAIDYNVAVARNWQSGHNCEFTDLTFRWMDAPTFYPVDSDFVQKGSEFHVTSYSTNQQSSFSPFYVFSVITNGFPTPLTIPGAWENERRGTFVQRFTTIAGGQHTFRLEAMAMGDHNNAVFKNEFYSAAIGAVIDPGDPTRPATDFRYGADAIVRVKNFNIFEVLVDDVEWVRPAATGIVPPTQSSRSGPPGRGQRRHGGASDRWNH